MVPDRGIFRRNVRSRETFFDFYQEKIRECDDQIETSLLQLSTGIKEPEGVLPSARHCTKQPNQLSFDVRPLLWKITGSDLTQIHGVVPYRC